MDYTDLRNDTEKCEEISDLGYSRTSHISAIDHERHVTDKFNGILYHVIPTYNQIAVMFSTKGFIVSLLPLWKRNCIQSHQTSKSLDMRLI